MKQKLALYLAGMLLVPAALLAQRKPNYTYKADAQKVFDTALKGALKNYTVTYINDKHLMFTFQTTHFSSNALQQNESLGVRYTAYFEDNGNGTCGLFLNSNELASVNSDVYKGFSSMVTYVLTGKQDAHAREVTKELQEQEQWNQQEAKKLKEMRDKILKKANKSSSH